MGGTETSSAIAQPTTAPTIAAEVNAKQLNNDFPPPPAVLSKQTADVVENVEIRPPPPYQAAKIMVILY